jgi:hypothetical protein
VAFSTDFAGRTVDLSIFQGIKPAGRQPIELSFGDAGEVITGIQKVAQSFALIFLTELGSKPFDPTFGTPFLTAMRLGRFRTEADVQNEFSAATQRVQQILDQEAVAAGLPEDERFDDAILESFVLDKLTSTLKLEVRIRSVAGVSETIFLPVPVAIS